MKESKKESLIKAMSFFLLKELPEVDNGENIWIKALALVKKRDGSEAYVYVVKDSKTLENKIAKDFGSGAQIVETVEYYPFSFLKSGYMPTFKTAKKEDRIKYLNKYDKNTNYSDMTLKELEREIIRLAVARQLLDESKKKFK